MWSSDDFGIVDRICWLLIWQRRTLVWRHLIWRDWKWYERRMMPRKVVQRCFISMSLHSRIWQMWSSMLMSRIMMLGRTSIIYKVDVLWMHKWNLVYFEKWDNLKEDGKQGEVEDYFGERLDSSKGDISMFFTKVGLVESNNLCHSHIPTTSSFNIFIFCPRLDTNSSENTLLLNSLALNFVNSQLLLSFAILYQERRKRSISSLW